MLSQIVQRGSAVLRTTKVAKDGVVPTPSSVAPVVATPKVHVAHVTHTVAPVATSSATIHTQHVPTHAHNREIQHQHQHHHRVPPRNPYSGPHHARSPHIPHRINQSAISIPGIAQQHAQINRTTVVSPQQSKPKQAALPSLPIAPEEGMVVEFLGRDGSFRLGFVSARVESAQEAEMWEISEQINGTTHKHEIPSSKITFCWPHSRNANSYTFSVEQLPMLTEKVQADMEKVRSNLPVIYGKFMDAQCTSIKIETLVAALFAQPFPHDYYIAHRLLQESEAFFRPGATHTGTSIVSDYVLNPLNVMSSLSKSISQKQKSIERKLFLHRLARKLWSTRTPSNSTSHIASLDTFVDSLALNGSSSSSPSVSSTPFSSAFDEFVSVLPELTEPELRLNVNWNPHRDAAFLAELKRFAFATGEMTEQKEISSLLQTKTTLLDPLDIPATPESVFKMLVQIGAVGEFDNPHVARHTGKLYFSGAELQAHTKQGITLAHNDLDRKLRRDFRNTGPIFAIDSRSESDEIDDAISVFRHADGSTWVHIHIADPSRLVGPNDGLDMLARQRVQSVYIPEKTSTMFPPNFSRHHFSLLPDKTNYALTFAVKLDPSTGQIIAFDITPSMIDRVTALTYDQADDLLRSAHSRTAPSSSRPLPPTHLAALTTLLDLADARRKCRERAGAAVYADQIRSEIEVLRNGETINIHAVRDSESISRAMVSEFMILVGEVTALFASQNSIPIPFRSQAKRGEQIVSSSASVTAALQQAAAAIAMSSSSSANASTQSNASSSASSSSLTSALTSPTPIVANSPQNNAVRARLCPAVTNVLPGEHAGLGVSAYCQASSPIRRYTDLIVHHQIKSYLRGDALPFTPAKLSSLISQVESTQSQLNTLAGNSSRYWTLRYLERQDPSRQYEALIASEAMPTMDYSSLKCSAWLTELGWRTDVLLDTNRICPTIGDRIKVTVSNVDAFNDVFEIRQVANTQSPASFVTDTSSDDFPTSPSPPL